MTPGSETLPAFKVTLAHDMTVCATLTRVKRCIVETLAFETQFQYESFEVSRGQLTSDTGNQALEKG